jgi:hypothetical protein
MRPGATRRGDDDDASPWPSLGLGGQNKPLLGERGTGQGAMRRTGHEGQWFSGSSPEKDAGRKEHHPSLTAAQ